MTDALLEWRGYRYFPYEREFARLETEQLFGEPTREDARGLCVSANAFSATAADRLTYVSRVICPDGPVLVPRQAALEASATAGERERQSTRYSAHGLHEYKGKFNPQVVRAIGNIIGLHDGAHVLDPFCGSGTTLLECAHAGWSATGLDRNPLAVHIANAKLTALRCATSGLAERVERLLAAVGAATVGMSAEDVDRGFFDARLGDGWRSELPSLGYLESWFPLGVLGQVVAIRRAIRAHFTSDRERAIFDVVLSDHLREASLQDPADLRLRRRKDALSNYPITEWFIDAVRTRIPRVVRARDAMRAVQGSQVAHLADVRAVVGTAPGMPLAGFDAVITSPPYETALPYIDTQRLSLVLLGLIPAEAIQGTEKQLIGAREIATSERRVHEEAIRRGAPELPTSVVELCRELLAASVGEGNGFRRRSRPALSYRYFLQMALYFANMRSLVRTGGLVSMVVGHNRTTLGGREFEIDTPGLLIDTAKHQGFSVRLQKPMETYRRYDLHQKNSIAAETLFVLENPVRVTDHVPPI